MRRWTRWTRRAPTSVAPDLGVSVFALATPEVSAIAGGANDRITATSTAPIKTFIIASSTSHTVRITHRSRRTPARIMHDCVADLNAKMSRRRYSGPGPTGQTGHALSSYLGWALGWRSSWLRQ